MRLPGLLLAIGAPLLAFAAWRDAAVEYWLDTGPDRAPWLLRSDPRMAIAANDMALLTQPEQDEAFWKAVSDAAGAALRREALDAGAVRQHGLADEALGRGGLPTRLQLAERISRRDTPTQVSMLRLAVDANDYRRTFVHLDTILATKPAAGVQFFPPMATLLADPEIRRTLAAYGRRQWFGSFAAAAVNTTEDPANLAALLIDSRAALPDTQDTLLPRLLSRLVDTGQYPVARDLALRFGKARPHALDGFAITPATADPHFAPLTWRLGESEAVQTGLSAQGTLEVELRPGTVVAVAERTTALAPGAYALEQRIHRDDDGELLVEWQLRCQHGDRTKLVWQQPLPMSETGGQSRSVVDVPGDCPIQYWRLTALADGTQSNATFRVARLRIGRAL